MGASSIKQDRRKVLNLVAKHLFLKRRNRSIDWIKKIPDISRNIEYLLYRSALSHEDYLDMKTMSTRIRNIVIITSSIKIEKETLDYASINCFYCLSFMQDIIAVTI